MELLKKRQFWVITGLMLAALAAVGLYALLPRPSPLNWLLDLFAFVATYLGGLVIISQFVLPVQTTPDRGRVMEHFVEYGLGTRGPIIFVKEGKLIARKEELLQNQAGVALLDPSSAIVLERAYARRAAILAGKRLGLPLVRAAGPGVVFIHRGERIVDTLDLRRQSRGTLAKALTKDGIEVSAFVGVTFGLSFEPAPASQSSGAAPADASRKPPERNKPARVFEPERAFRAVYGTALGDKQPGVWTELPVAVAVECFRNLLAEYTLDGLFQPTAQSVYPFGDFQARVTSMVKEAQVLKDRGIIVFGVGVGVPKMPREVINQRVRTWQARWQKAIIQNYASGKRQSILTQARWQTSAQEAIVEDLKTRLEAASSPAEKKALALVLTAALQRAATDPRTRDLVSKRDLKVLESLPELLK